MAIPVNMPRLGMTMEEGTVTSWVTKPGQRIEKGETLLVIETEKTEAEVEATASGWLRHVYVEEGQTVVPGTLLAALTETEDEAFDAEGFRQETAAQVQEAATTASDGKRAAPGTAERPPAASSGRPRATPRARRRARELGVALEGVTGTGPGGRITEEDVESAPARAPQLEAAARARRVEVAPGVALEVFEAGEEPAAAETVVLLPGFGSDLAVFAPQVEHLAGRFRVLGVHSRGVGGSSMPDADSYPVAEAAADVGAVIGELVGDSVHLVGASLGAGVALELALREPRHVRSLVLVTPFLDVSPRLGLVLAAWRQAARLKDTAGAAIVLPWLFSERFLADPDRRERVTKGLASMLRRSRPETLDRQAAGLAGWSVGRQRLRELAPRTLVLRGGADLLVAADAAIETIPRGRIEAMDGAGHALTLEAPQAVARAIEGFLVSA